MNRQQRRMLERQRATEARNLKHLHERRERLDEVVIEQFLVAAGLALHQEFGFGAKRIARVLNKMNELIGSQDGEVVTFQKYRQQLKDETGIEISWT